MLHFTILINTVALYMVYTLDTKVVSGAGVVVYHANAAAALLVPSAMVDRLCYFLYRSTTTATHTLRYTMGANLYKHHTALRVLIHRRTLSP